MSVCPSVCHVRELYQNKPAYLNFFSPPRNQTILVFPYQTLWQYSNWDLPNGGVERRLETGGVGDSQRIPGSIAYCERLDCPSAIHSAVTKRDKLMTLVAGKRRRLLLTGDDDDKCL